MRKKTAFLFAGQGAQTPETGSILRDTDPDMWDMIRETLGEAFADDFAEGRGIDETETAQPALLSYGLSLARAWEMKRGKPDSVSGLSLGEYTALTYAGMLTTEEALKLVRLRGMAMKRAGEGIDALMLAIKTEDHATARKIVETIDGVWMSNRNSAQQVCIAGEREAVGEAAVRLKEAGIRKAVPVNVSGAFHTPMMRPAADALREAFSILRFREPEIPVYSNIEAISLTAENAPEVLCRQVQETADLLAVAERFRTEGVEEIIEFGPKSVLAGALKKTLPDIPVRSITNREEI